MPESLTVKRIQSDNICKASDVPALLEREGVEWNAIACDNWNWSKCNPEVRFRIAHVNDAILLHFRVKDNELRAVETENDSRVWEDSCCEFFISPDSNDFYYNFECNCIGTLLLHGGERGKDRPSAPEETYGSVRRWSSLGNGKIERQAFKGEWDLVEIIPAAALFRHGIGELAGKEMRANFYKCGDLLTHPHFLSWAPIDLPKPMFHCPEFFRILRFEK